MKKDMQTIDGNTAATHVAYAYSEVAAIYPITPSSTMGELADEWSAHGRKNIFGQTVDVIEMQSEGGAAGAVHGSLSAGALTTTFTASQGLMLMLPNMHKIAGEMLPTLFLVSARALACQSLSIFGDHSDVMSARNTGFALTCAGSVQEAQDLAIVAYLSSLRTKIPFLHFFDGFRTSNVVEKVDLVSYDTLKELFEPQYLEDFRRRSLNPERPMQKVGQQNPDVYFQGRETVNKYYQECPGLVQHYMDNVAKAIGRQYHLFDYFGAPDADKVIIMMGSGAETAEETINYLNARGAKLGLIKVRLYRPFDTAALAAALPASAKKVAVLDRTKEPGAIGEPLYLDVAVALSGRPVKVIGGRSGLSSKEFTPAMVKSVYDHLDGPAFHGFTVGIIDDVTSTSIPVGPVLDTEPPGTVRCKFFGYGSDGTVGANKNSIKIIADHTDMYGQGYFQYDSKKSGGVTISHLRFGKQPIQSQYFLNTVDFIALHKPSYIGRLDILEGIREGGTSLINSDWPAAEVFEHLTEDMQRTIIDKKVKVYTIDALKIAGELGLGVRINSIMQACFFKLSGVLPEAEAITLMKKAVEKTYGRKGPEVVKMNWDAIDRAASALEAVPVPEKITKSAPVIKIVPDDASAYAREVIDPVTRFKGDLLPVSKMPLDGATPTATARLEKRGIATECPKWLPENCIQCNQCNFVCPHATIRAKQIAPADLVGAPEGFVTIKSNTRNDRGLLYREQCYIEDCVGCGSCADVCPAKNKALVMTPIAELRAAGEAQKAEFFDRLPDNVLDGIKPDTLKGSQFLRPLFEFSGACAGCGETPYLKLATQLFGDRMIIANATGCSSIYGGTFPTCPYAVNAEGKGPAWGNSLFEDNAEYGFGMRLAVDANRRLLAASIDAALAAGVTPAMTDALTRMKSVWTNVGDEGKAAAKAVRAALPEALVKANGSKPALTKIDELKDFLVEKSVWSIGGDGWAYDIGYGGLDHVVAMNRNINLLVLDTEVYSNTGGQASKSTPIGSVAKFASSGKKTSKKDLGRMVMTYGYVYVASVAMGANMNQCLKAFLEAESYPGPSLIIAYSPCINHGINMAKVQAEEKLAVDTGYWTLYRFNPLLAKEGKNPFLLDSKQPKLEYEAFLKNEVRYKTLVQQFPEIARELFAQAAVESRKRYETYKKMAE
ncbi:MAG: pyruvate:ferredoxin (flavodoxin) oxidoreductase [Candidatus Aminicenantes bacterium RBG_16_63_16]|nr:MAG: pyruvate:ferredoxin (flavodoxin) oxidoreductase [Candidatus Aminicenantes bacterium RBG_16_63_16]